MPPCEYYNYFKDVDFKLHIPPEESVVNLNTKKELNDIIMEVYENLRNIEPVPSAQIQQTPHSFFNLDDVKESEVDGENNYDFHVTIV